MDKKKILIVDDNEDSRFLLKYYLQDIGFSVIEAKNGKEGVESAIEERPDIILIDVMMPVMNGYTATKEIRKTLKEVPIISLTGNSAQSEKDKSDQAGCTDLVEKPIDLDQLTNIINKYTGKCL